MLTPLFKLSETDQTLTVVLHAPMAKLSEMEVCLDERLFYFTATPYFLKIELPGDVVTEENSIQTNISGGDIVVILQKVNPGIFGGLDLLSRFLAPESKRTFVGPLIVEPMSSITSLTEFTQQALDWFITSEELVIEDCVSIVPQTYGFSNSKEGLFKEESEATCAIDLPYPDRTSPSQRRQLREAEENKKFAAVHYLADLFEREAWRSMSESHPPWWTPSADVTSELSDEDRHRLIVLSSHRLPLPPSTQSEQIAIYLGLVDCLLAYTYDYRVREGDENTESGWNIVKLASTLSWFETFENLPALLRSFYRRALTFPLIRNWRFCRLIQLDVARLLRHTQVKSWCLKCLLDIRRLLIAYPGYHIFAHLYLDDYIVWIQTRASAEILHDLGEHLKSYRIPKDQVTEKLRPLEKLGKQHLKEEEMSKHLERLTVSDPTIC